MDVARPSVDAGGCALAANTSTTATINNGCALLTRDPSSCMAARVAAGLSGAWLQFSCRVQLASVTQNGQSDVQITADSQPDYPSNYFAPTDACYAATEYESFDRCQGHPQMRGMYHYHSEPYAISYDDDHLIGVMRDGYFVYGRRDMDDSIPNVDAAGGHLGTTPDSPSAPDYHVNLQTSTNAGTQGQTGWFLTTGKYEGAPGTCTGC